jgi:hypothetical protein
MRRRMRHRARGAHPVTGSPVVLTTAHRDHVPEHYGPANLFAACQRCHLAYDSGHHAMTRARTRQARATAGMGPLPGPWPEAADTGGTAEPEARATADQMRALTVRSPWAWAIARGWKPVENRGRPGYDGLIWPHLSDRLTV